MRNLQGITRSGAFPRVRWSAMPHPTLLSTATAGASDSPIAAAPKNLIGAGAEMLRREIRRGGGGGWERRAGGGWGGGGAGKKHPVGSGGWGAVEGGGGR